MLHSVSVGGISFEKSSGLLASSRMLSPSASAPAPSSADIAPSPDVALITTSADRTASANVPSVTLGFARCQSRYATLAGGFAVSRAIVEAGSRVPMVTVCAFSASAPASVCPTVPVPRMPICMAVDVEVQQPLITQRERER